MGLLNFLISRDAMGHVFSINYKGADTFQTALGGVLTLIIQLLTLVSLLKLTIEMIEMSEPNIQSYERPLLLEEVLELGEINFYDNRFVFGIVLESKEQREFIDLPQEVGRFEVHVDTILEKGRNKEVTEAVSCLDQGSWSDTNINVSDKKLAAMQKAYCIDHSVGA